MFDSESAPAVSFRDVRVGYPDGGFALRVERFAIERDETVALVGPSGSGKSTILRTIAGDLKPFERPARNASDEPPSSESDRGEGDRSSGALGLIVLGERVGSLSESDARRFRRDHLGISFQPFALLDALNALENVLLPETIGASVDDPAELRDNAMRLLRELGIERYAKRKPATLSHGERQRVALCRALVLRRPLVLLDEPTASLDPDSKRRAMTFATDEVRDYGGTLIVVTHDRDVLDSFDRIVDMSEIARVERDTAGDSPSPTREAAT